MKPQPLPDVDGISYIDIECIRGDRESNFMGFRVVSGLDTISRPFPSRIGKFVIVFIRPTSDDNISEMVYPIY